ncbi:MAG: hypothetical protein ACUVQP_10975 [Bacteroidales bacterium]
MLLIGILAVVQTVFLPGFIFISVFSIKTTSTIQKWVYVFALSLFLNYALVTILTLVEIYKPSVFVLIIAIELLIFIYLLIAKKNTIDLGINFKDIITDYISYLRSLSTSGKLIIIFTTIIVLFYFSLLISNLGTIFYFVDTVYNIHWNTWAIDFSNNILPKQSSHFPQLIPANWSISYLLIGEPNVHFFPKSFMPLFFLGNLLMFLDLAFDKRNYTYLFALIIYGLFAPIIYNLVFIADGNGDLPVSFFAFLSFYAYLKRNKEKFELKEFIIVFLFASTAAGTKLAGFYIFFFISMLCLYHFIKNFKLLSKKQFLTLFVSVVLILSIDLFWYLLKPATMASGLHQPEWLAEGYVNILINALHLAYYNIGLPVITFFILTIFFSLFVKESRYITIFFVLPPIILWMFKYSADFRNLSFVVPFISYTSAFGLIRIIEVLRNRKLNTVFIKNSGKEVRNDKKTVWLFVLSIPVGFICFFLIETNYFYQILYSIYSFINKYYFQSHRITYLTDITFLLPVDYYQRVFAMMFLLLSIASFLYILKTRIKDIIISIVIAAVFLNFTLITKSKILSHQKEEFDRVDARNYYQTISIILNSKENGKIVVTNFNTICTEKIEREIEFRFISDNKLINFINGVQELKSILFFIRLKHFEYSKQIKVRNAIIEKKFQILFDDGDYILFSK